MYRDRAAERRRGEGAKETEEGHGTGSNGAHGLDLDLLARARRGHRAIDVLQHDEPAAFRQAAMARNIAEELGRQNRGWISGWTLDVALDGFGRAAVVPIHELASSSSKLMLAEEDVVPVVEAFSRADGATAKATQQQQQQQQKLPHGKTGERGPGSRASGDAQFNDMEHVTERELLSAQEYSMTVVEDDAKSESESEGGDIFDVSAAPVIEECAFLKLDVGEVREFLHRVEQAMEIWRLNHPTNDSN